MANKGEPKYIEILDDPELFIYKGEGAERTVYGVKYDLARYGRIVVPEGAKVGRLFEHVKVREVILPQGMKEICAGAFEYCGYLERIYIPASVKTVGDDAFQGCRRLEIYCEDEPGEGWLNGEKVCKKYEVDMTEAFNFHRSSGSFDDCYIETRWEITNNNYNPDKRPVHTHVTPEQYAALEPLEFSEENDCR